MVYGVLKYYKLYILLIPYLVFWFNYLFFFLVLIFYLWDDKPKTIGFPKETEWVLINFIFILPKRNAFNSIYFMSKLSRKSCIIFFKTVSIVFIVGIPFIFLKILWMFLKKKDFWLTWNNISPYMDLKILVRNGKIIRNMKKAMIEGKKAYNEVLSKSGEIDKGLLKIKNGVHAVAHNTHVGVTLTTKKQNTSTFLVTRLNQTLVYAQFFNYNKITPLNEIKNLELKNLLSNNGNIWTIYANNFILSSKQMIIVNDKNSQTLVEVSDKDKIKANEYLKKCGGSELVKDAFEYHNIYTNIKDNGEKLLFLLSKTTPQNRKEILNNNIKFYKDLDLFEDSEDVLKIKIEIDIMMNEVSHI